MKKVMIMLAIAACFVTVAGPAQAALAWYPATITYTGLNAQDANVVYVAATSQTGAWTGERWFIATGSEAKAVLATALSGLSMGGSVMLVLESNEGFANWSGCYGIFLKSE